ncbi:MAG: GNAT family N-acetyltransferase [Proteobacteria bacterium]|nr:MAG: GNAT family N-acetyltransferase [Pseudomonadota bacterium]
MLSRLYSGSDSEQKSLSHFCQKYLQDSFWPYEEFNLSLKIPQTFLIFREEEGEAWQGFALARVIGGVAELFYIYVRSEMRGKGLALLLLKDMESHSLEKFNAESVMLEVRPSNLSAIRLYENSGYERIHVRKRYYQDGEDALIYNKALGKREGAV